MRNVLLAILVAILITACGETNTRKEINRRKAALVEKQKTELKKAQDELWRTDSLLQLASKELEAMTKEVEEHKKALKAPPRRADSTNQAESEARLDSYAVRGVRTENKIY